MCSENLILVSNQGRVFFPSSCALSCLRSTWWCLLLIPQGTHSPSPHLAVTASRLFWCIISLIQHNWLFIISTSPFYVFPSLSLFFKRNKPLTLSYSFCLFIRQRNTASQHFTGFIQHPSLIFHLFEKSVQNFIGWEWGRASFFHFLALWVTKAKILSVILLNHYNVFKLKFQI